VWKATSSWTWSILDARRGRAVEIAPTHRRPIWRAVKHLLKEASHASPLPPDWKDKLGAHGIEFSKGYWEDARARGAEMKWMA